LSLPSAQPDQKIHTADFFLKKKHMVVPPLGKKKNNKNATEAYVNSPPGE
jgi:hypothetical protein